MDSTAFARARRFLSYNAVAKWSAHLAAAGTGVLYVLLLVFLGLFADLIVNRGRLPAFFTLSAGDQRSFREQADEILQDEGRCLQALKLLNADDKQANLIVAETLKPANLSGAKEDLKYEWLWHMYMALALNDEVGPDAADLLG